MRYRVLDPKPIPFAAGLRPDDPMRVDDGTPFAGFARPHQSRAWIRVAIPTADLAPREFTAQGGVSMRYLWDNNGGDRARVQAMAASLRAGRRLPPTLVVNKGGKLPHLVDGYHRVAAARTAGRPEVESHLLVKNPARRP